jgi:hypothetical protein
MQVTVNEAGMLEDGETIDAMVLDSPFDEMLRLVPGPGSHTQAGAPGWERRSSP